MTAELNLIRSYYPTIDAQDIDGVMALFSEDATYVRGGKRFTGKSAIDRFFRHDRQIRGVHTVERIGLVDTDIVVIGRFEGKGTDGSAKILDFADQWRFGDNGKVAFRHSFLSSGYEASER